MTGSPNSRVRRKHVRSIIGFILFYGGLFGGLTISVPEKLPRLSELTWTLAAGFVASLAIFLLIVYFMLRHFPFSQIRFKSLRNSMIYGMCLALFFSVWPFFDSSNKSLFLMFYFSGLIVGGIYGWAGSRVMTRKILNDKIVVPGTFPESMQFEDYWKGVVIMFVLWGVSLILSREVFHSKTGWIGALTGMFLGLCLYTFFWAGLYEKRNNVRLTFEYSYPNQTSDTST